MVARTVAKYASCTSMLPLPQLRRIAFFVEQLLVLLHHGGHFYIFGQSLHTGKGLSIVSVTVTSPPPPPLRPGVFFRCNVR